eukprot:scaffold12232_cov149-Amphora_coffeaeformis.AAC.2
MNARATMKPPKQRKSNGKKRARPSTKTTCPTDGASDAFLELPNNISQKVNDLIDNFDYELHKDNLDSLAGHIQEELHILLHDEEEAHLLGAENAEEIADRLRQVISLAWKRRQKAERAFGLLDEAGKGVVVFEDLRRVANEFLEEEVTDEDLVEMIQVIDQSGDGILTKEDFHRLANTVNL